MPKETPELPTNPQEPQTEAPSLMDKLKIHKWKVLGGLLGIFVLAGVAFGAYQFVQNQTQPAATPFTPTQIPRQIPTENETALSYCGQPQSQWPEICEVGSVGMCGDKIILRSRCTDIGTIVLDEGGDFLEVCGGKKSSPQGCKFYPKNQECQHTVCPLSSEKNTQPQISVETLNGRCAKNDQLSGTISAQDQIIKFTGKVTPTATPCDSLDASLKQNGSKISIILTNQGSSTYCIECIGTVDFSGMVSGLAEGSYNIQLIYKTTESETTLDQKILSVN